LHIEVSDEKKGEGERKKRMEAEGKVTPDSFTTKKPSSRPGLRYDIHAFPRLLLMPEHPHLLLLV
jgi:hypothetical protein